MVLVRSLVFYAGLAVATLLFVPLSILLLPVNFPLRFRVISKWAAFNLWWLQITCRLKYEIKGRENIPVTGGGIIICKHQSAWETLVLQLIFPPQVWVLKRELLWIPIYGWGLAAMHPIAIDRSSGLRALNQIVEQGCARLAAGLWVVVFPEGTRTAPGERRKYHPGGGMLAEKSQAPVIPVAHNSGHFWPKSSLRKWPGTITMVIGPAIDPKGKSTKQIMKEAEDWIEATVAKLPAPNIIEPATGQDVKP